MVARIFLYPALIKILLPHNPFFENSRLKAVSKTTVFRRPIILPVFASQIYPKTHCENQRLVVESSFSFRTHEGTRYADWLHARL
jgi:hypothetical protein